MEILLCVVEDRILNGYNNCAARASSAATVVEDRILNGYNNLSLVVKAPYTL